MPLSGIEVPNWLHPPPRLDDGEELVGFYQNRIGSKERAVIITTRHLFFESSGNWESVGFSDIVEIKLPDEKSKAHRLVISDCIGRKSVLVIEGGEGQFWDVFEFCRFVERAKDDAAAAQSRFTQ